MIQHIDTSAPKSTPSLQLTELMATPVEAYRIMFSIGALHALFGALVWILFELRLIDNPIQVHPLMMSGGFLFSFAMGFLWTAVPRFTQSRVPTVAESSPLVALGLAGLVAEMMLSERWTLIFLFGSALWTLRFLVLRFRERRQDPPQSFIFVGAALLLGTLSLAILVLAQYIEVPLSLLFFARSFFLKGIMIFLVLGVGFRLIPAILGVNAPQRMELVQNQSSGAHSWKALPNSYLEHIALGLALVAAFVLESLLQIRLAAVVFSLCFCWAGFRGFHGHRIPALNNRFALSVWCSVVAIVLAPLLIVIFPERAVHIWHLLFIGGLGLMTIMVSVRVSVSHSGFASVHKEEQKSYIVWMTVLILISALTRMSVAWWPQVQSSHYVYAASLWIIMIFFWLRIVMGYSIKAERAKWQSLFQRS